MGSKKGRFDQSEEAFVRQNYLNMSDQQMGEILNREKSSIVQYRRRNGLDKKGVKVTVKKSVDNSMKEKAYINSLSITEKKKVLLSELQAKSQYRNTIKSLEKDEIVFYEERYIEFMMDPTVETMTASEKDALHRKTITEIRMLRFMEDEKNFRDNMSNANRSKEIQECQQAIFQCEKSLNVTREQRLKDGQDQSINFTNIIRELQNPRMRSEIGGEATMFKYQAEVHYNEHLGKNIFAGDDSKFDVSVNFISGDTPSGYDSNFLRRKNGGEEKE